MFFRATLLGELQLEQRLQRYYTPIYGVSIQQPGTFVKFEKAILPGVISRGTTLMSWTRNGLALAALPHEDTPL